MIARFTLFVASALLFGLPAHLFPQNLFFDEPLSQRLANYTIKVALDDSLKQLRGDLQLQWSNPSQDTIPDLQFHLYLNGFQLESTVAKEGKKGIFSRDSRTLGWIQVDDLRVRNTPHQQKMEFISPDDNNAGDKTVLRVMLDEPVLPGEKLNISMNFSAQLPRNTMRTGWWDGDFFMVAQWFPKIGVYEIPGQRNIPEDAERGQWNCHQFHARTEFYADFGTYDVEISVPAQYVVGTTGQIHKEIKNDDGSTTYFARAEDVHDFAWAADASVRVFNDEWHNVRSGQKVQIRLLLQPGNESAVDAYFESTRNSLQYFDEWLGDHAYPYASLTLIDAPLRSGAIGMEYPGLITGAASHMMNWWTGNKFRMTEDVVSHEIAHQYWYGLVASNEFEEALLDEGMATYSELRMADHFYGKDGNLIDFGGLQASVGLVRRAGYAQGNGQRDISLSEPTYANRAGTSMAYDKFSLALKTLEGIIGTERFDRIMKTYFQKWRFKHPGIKDFIAVANREAGENLDWFFDQIVFGDGVVDYAFAGLNVKTLTEGRTAVDSSKSDNGKPADQLRLSEVHVRRIGEVKLPVEILVGFKSGSTVLEKWDGKARQKTFTYRSVDFVDRVIIDPENKIALEIDKMNNGIVPANRAFEQTWKWKWLYWIQSLFSVMSIFS